MDDGGGDGFASVNVSVSVSGMLDVIKFGWIVLMSRRASC